MIDNSGSIRDNAPNNTNIYWDMTLNFVKSVVGMFNVGANDTRFALIDFGILF